MDTDRADADVVTRMRAALELQARSDTPLPALLAELKHLLHDLSPGEAERLRDVLAALRAVGRAWSEETAGEATLTLEGEHGIRDALADLRRAVDRLG